MDVKAILAVLEKVIDDSHTAVLSTVTEGEPRSRWVTPAVLRGRDGFIYTVTAPTFAKVAQIEANPRVEWLIQTRSLSEIVTARGHAQIIDNPSLKSDVLEAIGGHMTIFWRINPDTADFVIVETRIDQLDYFRPTKGERFSASFDNV